MVRNAGFKLVTCIVLISCLALYFSSFFFQNQNPGRFQVEDPDSLLFLRLFEQTLLRGEKPAFDEYSSFPGRLPIIYPPLHMALMVHLSLFFFYLFPESAVAPEYIVGALPPLIGWLICCVFAWFTWKKTKSQGLTLVISACMVPGAVAGMNSWFMRVDYHFLNNFFIWLWIFSSWKFCEAGKKALLVVGALVSASFILTWSGTPLFYGFVCLYVFFLWLGKSSFFERFAQYSYSSMVIASFLVFLFLISSGNNSFSMASFGWFQPSIILLGALCVRLTLAFPPPGSFDLTFVKKIIPLILALPVMIFFIFNEQITQGIAFFGKNDLLMQSISELKPLMSIDSIINPAWLINAMKYLGLLLFLWPVFLTSSPRGIFDGEARIIRDWCLLFLTLSVYSLRFFRWFGAGVNFAAGVAIYSIFAAIVSRNPNRNLLNIRAAVLLIPLLLTNFLLNFPYFIRGFHFSKDQVELYEWIRTQTPITGGYIDSNRPEYCFFCYWGEGNRINFYGQRPTLVNNTIIGYKKMAQILTSESESEVYSFLNKYSVRYLLADQRNIPENIVRYQYAYKERANVPDDFYSFFPDFDESKFMEKKFENTFFSWLADCCAIKKTGKFESPASRLRMVYSASQIDRFTGPEFMVYEFVAGAKISGSADPYSKVDLSLGCQFDKTLVLYKREVISDENGRFEFTVPYSNQFNSGRVVTDDFYKLSWKSSGKERKGKCLVTEKDVLNGKILLVKELE